MSVKDKDKKPSWIKKTEKKQCVTFKKTNVNIVTFLDEGLLTKKTIVLDDGEQKDIEPVVFEVMDKMDTKHKEAKTMDINSSRLLKALAEFYPLTGLSFEITAIGQDVERTYKVRPLQ